VVIGHRLSTPEKDDLLVHGRFDEVGDLRAREARIPREQRIGDEHVRLVGDQIAPVEHERRGLDRRVGGEVAAHGPGHEPVVRAREAAAMRHRRRDQHRSLVAAEHGQAIARPRGDRLADQHVLDVARGAHALEEGDVPLVLDRDDHPRRGIELEEQVLVDRQEELARLAMELELDHVEAAGGRQDRGVFVVERARPEVSDRDARDADREHDHVREQAIMHACASA
jgi:hypothetical protein